jgi:hypothetical protein
MAATGSLLKTAGNSWLYETGLTEWVFRIWNADRASEI